MTRPHLVLFHTESIFYKYSSTCVNDWGHSLHAFEFGCDYIIGASMSEPHISVTALRMCVCMLACLLACLRPYTVNFK